MPPEPFQRLTQSMVRLARMSAKEEATPIPGAQSLPQAVWDLGDTLITAQKAQVRRPS